MTEQITPLQQTLSACTGAVLTSLLMTPLDVVKIRLQSQPLPPAPGNNAVRTTSDRRFWGSSVPHYRRGAAFELSYFPKDFFRINGASAAAFKLASASSQMHFTGTLDAVMKIARYEGIYALWRGLAPAVAMSVPATVVYFVGYDRLRGYLGARWQGDREIYAPLVAGALARTIAATIISPLELVRTRMQAVSLASAGSSSVSETRQVLNGLARAARQDGLRALWRGLPPTLWRDVPFSAIYWTAYEHIKSQFLVVIPHLTSFELAFLSGATSGMIAATLTTPFDVAKTSKQTTPTSEGMIKLLTKILEREGIRGLFRGMGPRIAKVGPACAIMVASYEVGKEFFAGANDRQADGLETPTISADDARRISELLAEEL